MNIPVEIISKQYRLNEAVRDMVNSDVIGLDTESNSRHHYPEQLCLVHIRYRYQLLLF